MAVSESGLEKSPSATPWTSAAVTASTFVITSSIGMWRHVEVVELAQAEPDHPRLAALQPEEEVPLQLLLG